MLFEILFTIPIGQDSWQGYRHLPTIYINAPTRIDATRRANDFIVLLPPGSTFAITDVNGLLNEGTVESVPVLSQS